MQAQIAFSRYRHAQCTVAEHLDAHQVAVRPANIVAHDSVVNVAHLLQIDLAGKHHHIGKLRIEAHSLAVRHIHLSADVHFHVDRAGIENRSHIGGYDCRHLCLLGGIDNAAHERQVVVEHHSVHCEVAFQPIFVAVSGNAAHVVDSEVVCRLGTHIQALNAEVDGIGTALHGSHKRLP